MERSGNEVKDGSMKIPLAFSLDSFTEWNVNSSFLCITQLDSKETKEIEIIHKWVVNLFCSP